METSMLVPGHPQAGPDCLPEGALVQTGAVAHRVPPMPSLGFQTRLRRLGQQQQSLLGV